MLTDLSDIVKKKYPNNFDEYYIIGKNVISNIAKQDFLDNIDESFIDHALDKDDSKIMCYSNHDKSIIKNLLGIIVYAITQTNECINFYIILFGIKKSYRKFGYGTALINKFIEFCKNYKNTNNKKKKIILHSIDSSYYFYMSNGFTESENKYLYKKLYQYEKYNKNLNILEMEI
jgi:GNAT superfamily N-acetyltransferase